MECARGRTDSPSADHGTGARMRRRSRRVEIHTPLLPNPLEGAVYLATPAPLGKRDEPVRFARRDVHRRRRPGVGVLIKLAGEVTPNPATDSSSRRSRTRHSCPSKTSNCTSSAGNAHHWAPPRCAGATRRPRRSRRGRATRRWAPPRTSRSRPVPNGAPCQSPLPFSPSLTAGTTNMQAGAFQPVHDDDEPRRRQPEPAGDPVCRCRPGLLGHCSPA